MPFLTVCSPNLPQTQSMVNLQLFYGWHLAVQWTPLFFINQQRTTYKLAAGEPWNNLIVFASGFTTTIEILEIEIFFSKKKYFRFVLQNF